MGILGRVQQDLDENLLRQSTERLETDLVRQAQAVQLEAIIRDALAKFASSLEEELEVIVAGSFYRISDIVLQVELFQKHSKPAPDPSAGNGLVVMEYLVWLMGVDKRSQTIDRVRLGTLKFLDYNGLFSTITKAPSYLNLSAADVLEHRDQMDRFV